MSVDIVTEALPSGWDRVEVTRTSDGARVIHLRHIASGAHYVDDPLLLISFKCALISLAILPFAALSIGFHLLRTATLLVSSPFCCTGSVGGWFSHIGAIFVHESAAIARTPYYAVRILWAALRGSVSSPLERRRDIGQLEKEWHGTTYRFDIGIKGKLSPAEHWQDILTNLNTPYAYFMAPCMQEKTHRSS